MTEINKRRSLPVVVTESPLSPLFKTHRFPSLSPCNIHERLSSLFPPTERPFAFDSVSTSSQTSQPTSPLTSSHPSSTSSSPFHYSDAGSCIGSEQCVSLLQETMMKLFRAPIVVRVLVEMKVEEADDFALHFYRLSHFCQFERSALNVISEIEIADTTQSELLFRMDCISTKLFRHHNLTFGHQYLHALIGTYLTFVAKKMIHKLDVTCLRDIATVANQNDSEMSDANSNPMTGQKTEGIAGSVRRNELKHSMTQKKIGTAFDLLVRLVVGSFGALPREMTYVTRTISKMVNEKFEGVSKRNFIVSYFFLRYLCPAIAMPQMWFRIDLSDDMKKFCLLMSKILQGAANGYLFQNDHMTFANPMIERSLPKLDAFVRMLGGDEVTEEEKTEFFMCEKVFDEKTMQYYHECPMGFEKGCVEGLQSPSSSSSSSSSSYSSLGALGDSVIYFSEIFTKELLLRKAIKGRGWEKEKQDAALYLVKKLRKRFQLCNQALPKNTQ